MESASVPSNEHASTTGFNANSSSVRVKCDLAWDHVTEELKDGKSGGNRSGPSSFPPRSNLGKRKVGDIGNYVAPRTTPGAQTSIKSVLAGKEKKLRVDMVIARWMYDACISINAVNSSYYQPMLNVVASYGPRYKGPNYHALRVPLLSEAKREVQLIVDSHRSYWANTGCTIMADGWTDTRHRTLINFLVYYPKGIIFIRSIDASDLEIEKMDHVAKLAKRASKITVFIYNHVALQAWLRTRNNWAEIVRPGLTRFATTFIALGSLKEHKHDLQALVTSKFYVESRYAKDKKAKAVVKIILDNQFWNDCHVIMHIMSPLIRLLHIVDSDEKPAMVYVYDGMYRVIDGIKKKFKDKKRLWEPFVNIIKDHEWWKFFGSCAPTLQKFVIRILSQTAASSGCERNWSVFEQIHTKRRNRLEHQRLNDLVYVHYNHRLKKRYILYNLLVSMFLKFNKTEFWLVEDEEPPSLEHEEIENPLYEEGAYPIEEGSSNHLQRDMDNEVIEDDDDINLESFSDEDDAPPGFRGKNHPIHVKDEEDEDEDDDNDASGGAFGSHDDIDFNFLHKK
ncbi:hypothetical protein SO802_025782 [Lithocarpus litseifolius]|uniref:DUF659 domain-containing protein n=1 Tax=Lithocarpus litseifolius TaxID=425828 RepID=A0AAW2C098_9ROSI